MSCREAGRGPPRTWHYLKREDSRRVAEGAVARIRLKSVGVIDAALAGGEVLAEEVGFGRDAGHADDLVADAAFAVARDALGFPARVAGPGPQGPEGVGADGRGRVVAGVGGLAGLGGAVLGKRRGRRRVARARVALQPVWKSKFYGAFVLNRRVVLHAIDATPARWFLTARPSQDGRVIAEK